MARGWESKNVEDQVAEREAQRQQPRAPREPGTAEELARAAQRRSELEGLRRSRLLVLHELELVDSPRRRRALQAALADLDARLAAAGAAR